MVVGSVRRWAVGGALVVRCACCVLCEVGDGALCVLCAAFVPASRRQVQRGSLLTLPSTRPYVFLAPSLPRPAPCKLV